MNKIYILLCLKYLLKHFFKQKPHGQPKYKLNWLCSTNNHGDQKMYKRGICNPLTFPLDQPLIRIIAMINDGGVNKFGISTPKKNSYFTVPNNIAWILFCCFRQFRHVVMNIHRPAYTIITKPLGDPENNIYKRIYV